MLEKAVLLQFEIPQNLPAFNKTPTFNKTVVSIFKHLEPLW